MSAIAIDHLTPQEKLDLIDRLVDSLEPGDIPLPPGHREELERRLVDIDAGRVEWLDAADVLAGLDALAARARA